MVRDPIPLTPILTDGRWSFTLRICGADENSPLDQSGTVWDVNFAPARQAQPAAGDVHTFTAAGGKIVPNGADVNVTLANDDLAGGWKPGTYLAEFRRQNGADWDPLYVATVEVARGLSQLAAQGGGGPMPAQQSAVRALVTEGDRVVVLGPGAAVSADAQASADAAHQDRLLADNDVILTHADVELTHLDVQLTHNDVILTDADAAAARTDRLLADNDVILTHADVDLTHADVQLTHNDVILADADAATANGAATTATTQAGIATTQASAAAGSATAAAASAASANQNDTAGAAAIWERAATNDPAASLAQAAASVSRGAEFRPAASAGTAYFRRGLLASSTLTAIASFTRTATATGTDQAGNVFSVAGGSPRVSTAGYLSEQAATNLLLRSQSFLTGGVWLTSNSPVVTDNAAAAPDGTTTASSFNPNGTGGLIFQAFAVTPGATYTYSAYVLLGTLAAADYKVAIFDQTNGAFILGDTAPVVIGGGAVSASAWKRVSLTFTAPVGCTTARVNAFHNGASPTGTVLLWGHQVEAGSFATSYIPTTTAAVTRDKDVCQATVNIPVGQGFTITGRVTQPAVTGGVIFELAPASGSADQLRLFVNGGTALTLQMAAGGFPAVTPSIVGLNGAGAPVGFAISVNGPIVTWSVNGSAARTDNLGAAFAQALTRLFIGCNSVTTAQLNAPGRELNLYMRAMSAAEVAVFSDVSLEEDLDFTTAAYRFVGEAFALTELPALTFTGSGGAVQNSNWNFKAIASGQPRISDAGVTVEPTRVNLALNSRTPAAWPAGVGGAKTTSSDLWTAFNATLFTADGTSAQHYQASDVATFANGTAYCVSAFVFPSGRFQIALPSSIFGPNAWVNFNGAAAGSVTSSGAAVTGSGIVQAPGGSWYLAWVVAPAIAAGTDNAALFSPLVTGAEGRLPVLTSSQALRVEDVQAEAGTYPSAPITTTTAAVQRNADLLTTTVASPASFSVQAEFTIPKWGPASAPAWRWDDGTANNFAQVLYDRAAGHLYFQVTTAGVSQANIDLGAVTPGTTYKVAGAVAANDVAVSIGGAAPLTDATCTVPALTTFRTGNDGTNFWGYGLRKRKRFRGRQSNANLQALSA